MPKRKLPEVKYEVLKLKELNPAKYNPRIMTAEQLSSLAESIERGGMLEPIIVNKRGMTIIGGHQRYKILTTEFEADETMCVIVDVDKTTEKQLNLALNKISGFWDEEKVSDLIYELKQEQTSAIGFTEEETNQYLMQRELRNGNEQSYEPEDDDKLREILENNERVGIPVREPETPIRKDQLAFYVETIEEYQTIREYFKTTRKGELDKEKLLNLL